MNYVSVAIDGPSGAGKSTIAKRAAAHFSFIYVDTGALYRAIGYVAATKGCDTAVAEQVVPILNDIKLELKYINGIQRVFANGEDVSDHIRTPEMSMNASNVSAIPKVREFLIDLQRNMAENNNVIMDGRDIGTVILPKAQVKIFLTASPEERAKRRYEEYISKNQKADYDEILQSVIKRDYNDSTRATAPLKQADDAILIDTTGFELENSVSLVIETIAKKLNCK